MVPHAQHLLEELPQPDVDVEDVREVGAGDGEAWSSDCGVVGLLGYTA